MATYVWALSRSRPVEKSRLTDRQNQRPSDLRIRKIRTFSDVLVRVPAADGRRVVRRSLHGAEALRMSSCLGAATLSGERTNLTITAGPGHHVSAQAPRRGNAR